MTDEANKTCKTYKADKTGTNIQDIQNKRDTEDKQRKLSQCDPT